MPSQAPDPAAICAFLTGREGRPPEVRETHISWVFLTEARAYKLKKPLVLPFLDYGSPEKRKHMCCEELRLNRRLAPDVYLGVRSIVPDSRGVALSPLEDPEAIDYVVEMRRYSEAGTLASRLRDGDATPEDARRVGARLAEFHAACPARAGGASAAHEVESEIDRNVLELLDVVSDDGDRVRIRTAWRFLIARVRSRHSQLADRARRGLVREGHGDVRAEHILLGERVEIVDCLEFDAALRTLDVADELGFLVMDLVDARADHLVGPVLEGYSRAGGDCGDDSLVALFAVHRALVRAKVSWMTAGEHPDQAQVPLRRARRFLRTADRLSWRARLPLALIICGLPASGKSHLAEHLSRQSGLPVLSSDVTRKELAGMAPTEPASAAHYTPQFNRRTYTELGRRARRCVEDRSGVLVDGTFRHAEDRRAFMAEFGSRSCVVVECLAPPEVLRRRASMRERDASRVSDADSEVVERLQNDWTPLGEIPADGHLILRSDRPVGRMVEDLTALLDDRLLGGR